MNYKVDGLLLTAGFSKRMGKPKALLLEAGLPFGIVILQKMRVVCESIVVVLGHSADLIKKELQKYTNEDKELRQKVRFVTNKNYRQGMITSLQCGLRNLMNSEWILYHFVDQPRIDLSFYSNLTEQIAEEYNWIQPTFEGNSAHPILIRKSVFKLIIDLQLNSTLRDLKSHPDIKKKFWSCGNPETLQDIDTPSDL